MHTEPLVGENATVPEGAMGSPVLMADASQNGGDSGLQDLDGLDDSFFEDDFAADELEVDGAAMSDPFEGFNRGMFAFNDWVYANLLDPVSKGYTAIMPDPFETGIENFFSNLRFPVRVVNHTLQGNLDLAGKETGRFLVDSTVGVLGFMKPSDDIPDLANGDTDLGMTFGTWGIDHGPYLILPFIGPSSTRDLIGFIGDSFLDPTNLIDEDEVRIGLGALDFINRSDEILINYDRVVESSLDPYIAIKDIYQKRRNQDLMVRRNLEK